MGGSALGDGGCSAPCPGRQQAAIVGRDGRTAAQGACPAGTEVLGAGMVTLPLGGPPGLASRLRCDEAVIGWQLG